jgi:membrane fusion protein, multidrug efflux system
MFNHKIIIALGILVPVLMSCHHRNEPAGPAGQLIPVKVQKVTYSRDSVRNYYVGVVEESQCIPLSFLTAGTVEQVLFDEGQHVEKGRLLAALNTTNYQSTLQLATAKEKQAKDAYDRLSAVFQSGSLPEIKMVEIETGLDQANAAVQIARKNLHDCNLYAPVNGIIGKRSVEPGMNAVPGITVMTIVKIEKVFIRVSIPENEIASTAIGQKVVVQVPALNNKLFHGIVEQKGVMANLLSHTYDIKIGISNKEETLIPGMVCNVLINEPASDKTVSIPHQSVQTDPEGKTYVFTVDTITRRVIRKNIETGALSGMGKVLVAQGLKDGDQLVVEGYQKIRPNTPVQIIR